MTMDLAAVPLWAAIVAAVFFVVGSVLTLLGAIGLARFDSFYRRIHAPTLGSSWGTGGMVMGSMIIFSAASGRPVLHDLLIGIFVTVTTPITLMMLGRSALYRDRSEGNAEVPAMAAAKEEPGHVPDATPVERPSV
jgi:multicomponent K+:H+ antiporter subunit G